MGYGERISKLRQDKNITQRQLASKLFVTDKTISSWESNRTEPSLEMIIRLSEVLECSASYLLYGNNTKDNVEMEIKIRLDKEEYNYLIEYMEQKGKFIIESNQHDTYYQSDYLNVDIDGLLRIRENGNKKVLTYKILKNNEKHVQNDGRRPARRCHAVHRLQKRRGNHQHQQHHPDLCCDCHL